MSDRPAAERGGGVELRRRGRRAAGGADEDPVMPEHGDRRPERDPDEFERLRPLLRELAQRDADDPERRRCFDRLVTGHLPLVEHAVRRYAGEGASPRDLLEVGVIALVSAIERFDPDTGGDFLLFAIPLVVGEMRRCVRDTAWPERTPPPLPSPRDGGGGEPAPRPTFAAALAARLGVDRTQVAELVAAWEAAQDSSPAPEADPRT
ncbi:sigma factor [Glycomyces terrestris]|uniref:RNA polymerase sigma-70 region 2 domain-containing protein n=1 Tax=Glycomyces terrestris TaxID=2493553 RepID=A0A426V2Y2_9ACTN|nr:sigma factor [Glycomyces terrestris]RRS01264.1 hypothetical protein EIW28_00310 [Glycomyces terrestris]